MSYPYNSVTALTGIIGSGKSLAAEYFRDLGATLISADKLARTVVEPGTEGYRAVVQEFGEQILGADKSIDRKRLGAEIFADESRRQRLEQITHPLIQKEAQAAFIAAIDSSNAPILYDCPLFFEAGLDSFGYQSIVLIAAPRELCIARIMKRDGFTREEASSRVDAQIPLEYKRKHSTHIIENDKGMDDLRLAVETVFNSLKD